MKKTGSQFNENSGTPAGEMGSSPKKARHALNRSKYNLNNNLLNYIESTDKYKSRDISVLLTSPSLRKNINKQRQVFEILLETNKSDLADVLPFLLPKRDNIAIQGIIERIERSLRRGFLNINQLNEEGETPIIQAVKNKNPDVIRFLMDNGADLNARDTNGRTPLMHMLGTQFGLHNRAEGIILLEFLRSPVVDRLATDNEGNNMLEYLLNDRHIPANFNDPFNILEVWRREILRIMIKEYPEDFNKLIKNISLGISHLIKRLTLTHLPIPHNVAREISRYGGRRTRRGVRKPKRKTRAVKKYSSKK